MKYLALDLETTGLDPTRDRILEVAAISVNERFVACGEYEDVLICPLARELANEYVSEMHTKNGLFGLVDHSLKCVAESEEGLIEFIGDKKPMLIGFSVHFDRGFLKHWMPRFESMLHHRHIDASSLAAVLDLGKPEPAHRAMEDARDSLRVVRLARDTWKAGYDKSSEDHGR